MFDWLKNLFRPAAPKLEPEVVASSDVPHAAIALVERFEGCRLEPYLCPAGIPTIGIGSTRYPDGRKVALSDPPISRARAEEMARHDLASAAEDVKRLVRAPLAPHQRAALILFIHNLGGGAAVASSTLLRLVNAGAPQAAALQFDAWVKARDPRTKEMVTLRGLQIRRRAERLLFEGMEPGAAYAQAQKDFPPRR